MLCSKQKSELLATLYSVWNEEQNAINGNRFRRVIGSVTTNNCLSPFGLVRENKSYNAYLDERQRSFLDSVGSVLPHYKRSVSNCFKGVKNFKHNPNLTYAFEVLKKATENENKCLAFITIQLSDLESLYLYKKDSPATVIRSKLTRILQRTLSSSPRGLIVLERSCERKVEKASDNGIAELSVDTNYGLHAHMLLVADKSDFLEENRRDVVKALSALSTGAKNAISIKFGYTIKRLNENVGGFRKDTLIESVLPIDGSLMDYLSKELDNPISRSGKQNFALIGIRKDVKRLWEEYYSKQVKLNNAMEAITSEIKHGIHPGDIQERISEVL